jgi:putative ATPase
MINALSAARDYPDLPVPLQLRNAPTKLMKNLGYGKEYEWKSNFQPRKGFLPNEINDLKIVED